METYHRFVKKLPTQIDLDHIYFQCALFYSRTIFQFLKKYRQTKDI